MRPLSAFGRRVLLFDLGDCVGEQVQVCVEREEEALNGAPLHAPASPLDTRDVRRVHPQECRELLLRDPCSVPQSSQGAPERLSRSPWEFVVAGGV